MIGAFRHRDVVREVVGVVTVVVRRRRADHWRVTAVVVVVGDRARLVGGVVLEIGVRFRDRPVITHGATTFARPVPVCRRAFEWRSRGTMGGGPPPRSGGTSCDNK